MVLRARKIAFVGSLALLASAVLLLGGPLSDAAGASPCVRYGKAMPGELNKRQARARCAAC